MPTTVYVDFDAFVRLALVDGHKKGKVVWKQASKAVVKKAYKWLGLRFVVHACQRSYRACPGNVHSRPVRLVLTASYLLTTPWSVPGTWLLKNLAWRLKIFNWAITKRPYLLCLGVWSDTASFSLYLATLTTAISIGLNGYSRAAEKALLLLTIMSGDFTSVMRAWHVVAKEVQAANAQQDDLELHDVVHDDGEDSAAKLACLANVYGRIYMALRSTTSSLAYASFGVSFVENRVASYIGAEFSVILILSNLMFDAGYPLYMFGDVTSRRLALSAVKKKVEDSVAAPGPAIDGGGDLVDVEQRPGSLRLQVTPRGRRTDSSASDISDITLSSTPDSSPENEARNSLRSVNNRPQTPLAADGEMALESGNLRVNLDATTERMKTASRLLDTYKRPRFFGQRGLININPEQMVRLLRHFAGEQLEISRPIELRADLNSWLDGCSGVSRQGRLVPVIVGIDNNNYHWSALHISPEGEMSYFDPFFCSEMLETVVRELRLKHQYQFPNIFDESALGDGYFSALHLVGLVRFLLQGQVEVKNYCRDVVAKGVFGCVREYSEILQLTEQVEDSNVVVTTPQ